MLYPTINQYIDTLVDATNFSRSLAGVEFCTTPAGDAIYGSGNFGVVFKMQHRGEIFALKCFTRHQIHRASAYRRLCDSLPVSDYLIALDWLPEELFVAPYGVELLHCFDVLRMEYVEGQTLIEVVGQAARRGDRRTLAQLSEAFDGLALWLLEQDFAHGDIKPENIMVANDGRLRLVDYDGLYLPSMLGEAQREIGTETFQHPLRRQMKFSKAIDDYSLALMSLSLRALACEPELINRANSGRGELLIHPIDAVDRSSSVLDYIESSALVSADLIACVRSPTPEIAYLSEIIERCDHCLEVNTLHPIKGENDRWGFASVDGVVVVSQIYDQVQPFVDGLAAVCMGGRWGFIDELGAIVVRIIYHRVWQFSDDGLALVLRDAKYGFVRRDGRVAIKPIFDYAASFSEGLAVAVIDNRYGFIDNRGRWVIEAIYDFARSFRGGVAEVELGGEKLSITRG